MIMVYINLGNSLVLAALPDLCFSNGIDRLATWSQPDGKVKLDFQYYRVQVTDQPKC